MWVTTNEGSISIFLDPAQKKISPASHVCLSGADRQCLVHQHADWDLVDEPTLDAGYREKASGFTDIDHFARDVWPITEQTCRRMADHRFGDLLVEVTHLTQRVVSPPTLLALAAEDRERDDNTLTFSQATVHATAYLDNLTHGLVAYDVSRQHPGNEVVKQMKIRAANG
jgi:hypothetical protein